MREVLDLLVAGAGPVGLATALHAADAGLDVAVWDPRAGVVDKACGEGLMPGAVAALTGLGVDLEGHPITGIRYLDHRDPARHADADFAHGPGLGVRRTTLHAAMLDRAAARGVVPEQRRVAAIADRGDHLLVDGVATRHLVGADGLHSAVRRLAGLAGPRSTRRRHGLRCHVDVAPWTSRVEVHWAPRSEAYVTPVSPGRVGVAVLTEDRASLPELLRAFPQLQARLAGHAVQPTLGAGPLRQRTRGRVAGRVLLVGDAAGYVDALTGEGIALGLAQARVAVVAVAAGTPERYEATYRRLVRRHATLTSALLLASRSPARRYVVPLAARLPRVFAVAVDQLARPAT